MLLLAEKPLIAYSIEAGLMSRYIDNVIVSSDADEILEIARKYGADTYKRAEILATDSASSVDVVLDIVENFKDYDYIVLLQPTSPLRTGKHVDEAIEQLMQKSADAIVSVCELEHSVLWSNTLDDSRSMKDFLDASVVGKRSQDLVPYYRLNGAIYICEWQSFLEEKRFFLKDNIFAYIMSKSDSIDIDEKLDFLLVETIMKENKC